MVDVAGVCGDHLCGGFVVGVLFGGTGKHVFAVYSVAYSGDAGAAAGKVGGAVAACAPAGESQ